MKKIKFVAITLLACLLLNSCISGNRVTARNIVQARFPNAEVYTINDSHFNFIVYDTLNHSIFFVKTLNALDDSISQIDIIRY